MKPTTALFLLAGTVLAGSHYLALEFLLYWRFLWLDIPMHLLGGVVVGLGYLSLKDLFPRLSARLFSLAAVVIAVLLVAIAWEIFEVVIGVVFDEARYVYDTAADLSLGLLGGVVAHIVSRSLNRLYE